MFKVAFFFALLALACAKDYTGYKVLETETLNAQKAKLLQTVREKWHQYDFWKSPVRGGKAKIMSSPEDLPQLEVFLRSHVIKNNVVIEDVEKVIQANKPRPRVPGESASPRITFTEYHTHDEINAYIDSLSGSESWIDTVSIGNTYEGNDMRAIRITKAGAGAPNVVVEAGIHAREWIAPAVCTYLISQLAENKVENANYLDNLNFYILPVANPDGYEYTWSNDRLWRKNRAPSGGACLGTDLNRNWGFQWGVSGDSDNSCSDVFHGTGPFSELESQNMRDHFGNLNPQPKLTVALHSAAEMILYPYGYARNEFPDNVDEIRDLGQDAVDALNAKHGESFTLVNAADLYPASGASDDWYASQGVQYVFTPELREADFGSVFILPEDEILPSGEEMFEAFKVMFQRVIDESKKEH